MTVKDHSQNSTLDCATAFAQRDMHLIPIFAPKETPAGLICGCGKADCSSPAKHPVTSLVPNGVKNATKDIDTLKRWFGSGEQFNLAMAGGKLSDTAILDIDARHGGYETLSSLETQHGKLPETLRWHTGGGGEHRIFKYPLEGLKNSNGRIGPGLDIKSDNGYVVIPPSRHISGNFYRFPDECSIDDLKADLPGWVIEANKRKAEQSEKQNSTSSQGKIFEGGRNDAVTKKAGVLIGNGLSFQLSLEFMLAWNMAHCDPPLTDHEVNSVVESIFRAESSKPAPPMLCAADFPPEVPPREWVVNGLMPKGRVTAMIGPGGVGKSVLSQQLAAVLAANSSEEPTHGEPM